MASRLRGRLQPHSISGLKVSHNDASRSLAYHCLLVAVANEGILELLAAQGGDMVTSDTVDAQDWDLGQVARLAGLVDYVPGSVANRVIVDRHNGIVSVQAFDRDQGFRDRTTPSGALLYALEGQAEISIAGQSLVLRVGEAVRVPARQPHTLRAVSRFKMLSVTIRS
jgi:quercetin dioxygenase-like cupin family protein